MKLRVIATLVAVLAFGVGSASAQSIGIFSDLGSASCNINAPLYTPTDFYINVIGSAGLTGAEFQVVHSMGIGVDILITPTANPVANVDLGNPMTGGCNIAFPGCQAGPSINLYTVSATVLNAANVTDVFMVVDGHTSPSNANFDCSLINLCDAPAFTSFCVAGGGAWMNSQTDCNVAVEDKTWGEVKNLFN